MTSGGNDAVEESPFIVKKTETMVPPGILSLAEAVPTTSAPATIGPRSTLTVKKLFPAHAGLTTLQLNKLVAPAVLRGIVILTALVVTGKSSVRENGGATSEYVKAAGGTPVADTVTAPVALDTAIPVPATRDVTPPPPPPDALIVTTPSPVGGLRVMLGPATSWVTPPPGPVDPATAQRASACEGPANVADGRRLIILSSNKLNFLDSLIVPLPGESFG